MFEETERKRTHIQMDKILKVGYLADYVISFFGNRIETFQSKIKELVADAGFVISHLTNYRDGISDNHWGYLF